MNYVMFLSALILYTSLALPEHTLPILSTTSTEHTTAKGGNTMRLTGSNPDSTVKSFLSFWCKKWQNERRKCRIWYENSIPRVASVAILPIHWVSLSSNTCIICVDSENTALRGCSLPSGKHRCSCTRSFPWTLSTVDPILSTDYCLILQVLLPETSLATV